MKDDGEGDEDGDGELILGRNIVFDEEGNPTGDPRILEQNRPPCEHYARKCSIISPCCGIVFG